MVANLQGNELRALNALPLSAEKDLYDKTPTGKRIYELLKAFENRNDATGLEEAGRLFWQQISAPPDLSARDAPPRPPFQGPSDSRSHPPPSSGHAPGGYSQYASNQDAGTGAGPGTSTSGHNHSQSRTRTAQPIYMHPDPPTSSMSSGSPFIPRSTNSCMPVNGAAPRLSYNTGFTARGMSYGAGSANSNYSLSEPQFSRPVSSSSIASSNSVNSPTLSQLLQYPRYQSNGPNTAYRVAYAPNAPTSGQLPINSVVQTRSYASCPYPQQWHQGHQSLQPNAAPRLQPQTASQYPHQKSASEVYQQSAITIQKHQMRFQQEKARKCAMGVNQASQTQVLTASGVDRPEPPVHTAQIYPLSQILQPPPQGIIDAMEQSSMSSRQAMLYQSSTNPPSIPENPFRAPLGTVYPLVPNNLFQAPPVPSPSVSNTQNNTSRTLPSLALVPTAPPPPPPSNKPKKKYAVALDSSASKEAIPPPISSTFLSTFSSNPSLNAHITPSNTVLSTTTPTAVVPSEASLSSNPPFLRSRSATSIPSPFYLPNSIAELSAPLAPLLPSSTQSNDPQLSSTHAAPSTPPPPLNLKRSRGRPKKDTFSSVTPLNSSNRSIPPISAPSTSHDPVNGPPAKRPRGRPRTKLPNSPVIIE